MFKKVLWVMLIMLIKLPSHEKMCASYNFDVVFQRLVNGYF